MILIVLRYNPKEVPRDLLTRLDTLLTNKDMVERYIRDSNLEFITSETDSLYLRQENKTRWAYTDYLGLPETDPNVRYYYIKVGAELIKSGGVICGASGFVVMTIKNKHATDDVLCAEVSKMFNTINGYVNKYLIVSKTPGEEFLLGYSSFITPKTRLEFVQSTKGVIQFYRMTELYKHFTSKPLRLYHPKALMPEITMH